MSGLTPTAVLWQIWFCREEAPCTSEQPRPSAGCFPSLGRVFIPLSHSHPWTTAHSLCGTSSVRVYRCPECWPCLGHVPRCCRPEGNCWKCRKPQRTELKSTHSPDLRDDAVDEVERLDVWPKVEESAAARALKVSGRRGQKEKYFSRRQSCSLNQDRWCIRAMACWHQVMVITKSFLRTSLDRTLHTCSFYDT